jgi:cysteine desulfurase
MDNIYLDFNSTTPIDPEVANTVASYYQQGFLNPASQHREGQRARRELEKLRTKIIGFLGGKNSGMEADQLVVTSGGTEANNLALIGLATHAAGKLNLTGQDSQDAKGRVIVSSIEHPSVIGAAEALQRMGYKTEFLEVDQNGVADLEHLKGLLDSNTKLPVLVVSLMLANNETGVIQPVSEAAALCRERSILFHTDAVQAVGKTNDDFANFSRLNVDAMTFTAHKLHGPRGIGGLLLQHGVSIDPILFGGFQQMAMRPGTEDVALMAGMCKAIELALRDSERAQRMSTLRRQLEDGLRSRHPELNINGESASRLPHTSNVSFPGVDRQEFLMAADFAGLAISTGSACASGSSEFSPVLLAMKADHDIVQGSIRISIGATTTSQEIETAIERICRIVDNLSKTGS